MAIRRIRRARKVCNDFNVSIIELSAWCLLCGQSARSGQRWLCSATDQRRSAGALRLRLAGCQQLARCRATPARTMAEAAGVATMLAQRRFGCVATSARNVGHAWARAYYALDRAGAGPARGRQSGGRSVARAPLLKNCWVWIFLSWNFAAIGAPRA